MALLNIFDIAGSALTAQSQRLNVAASNLANADSAVSYTHLRAHETRHDLVCRLLLEKKKKRMTSSA